MDYVERGKGVRKDSGNFREGALVSYSRILEQVKLRYLWDHVSYENAGLCDLEVYEMVESAQLQWQI